MAARSAVSEMLRTRGSPVLILIAYLNFDRFPTLGLASIPELRGCRKGLVYGCTLQRQRRNGPTMQPWSSNYICVNGLNNVFVNDILQIIVNGLRITRTFGKQVFNLGNPVMQTVGYSILLGREQAILVL